MSAPDPAKRLTSLVKRLRTLHSGEIAMAHGVAGTPPDWADPLVDELVYSFLIWETNSAHAKAALRRLRESVVDYNELRVCLPDELAVMLGDRYPRALERAQRLHASLTDLYRREHVITLSHLTSAPKREARVYLESLDGSPPFVSARLMLLCFAGHALPVDERLRDLLAAEGVADPASAPETVSAWLERHVRAPDAVLTHTLLQAWADGAAQRREKKTEPRPDGEAPSAPKGHARKPRAKSSG